MSSTKRDSTICIALILHLDFVFVCAAASGEFCKEGFDGCNDSILHFDFCSCAVCSFLRSLSRGI